MDNYINRLVTFASWPDDVTVSAIALSEVGFYYVGHGDEVECFMCKVRIKSWKNDDDPLIKHLQVSPMCSFVKKNKPKRQTKENPSNRNNLYEAKNNRLDAKSLMRPLSNTEVPTEQNYSPYYAIESLPIKHTILHHQSNPIDYTIEAIRLASFTNEWPANSPVLPTDIAAAGMYFTGPGDRVQCAWCKGGLYNWEAGDIPINEHKRHFPKCPFIIAKFTENEGIEHKMQGVRLIDIEKKPVEFESITEKSTAYQLKTSTEQQDNWRKLPAVKIVQDMGFSDKLIEKAMKIILKNSCSITTDLLMDKLFELESQEEDNNSGYETLEAEEAQEEASGRSNNNSQIQKDIVSDEKEISHLKEENVQLKDTTTCKICLDNPVSVLFLPCRHLVCCEECGDSVAQCPVCRVVIVGTINTSLG